MMNQALIRHSSFSISNLKVQLLFDFTLFFFEDFFVVGAQPFKTAAQSAQLLAHERAVLFHPFRDSFRAATLAFCRDNESGMLD